MKGLRNPIKSMRMPGGSNERDRRLQPEEETKLLPVLEGINPYMRPLAELAIETAVRQGELLTLTWGVVDLQKQVAYLADSKNDEPPAVPLIMTSNCRAPVHSLQAGPFTVTDRLHEVG